MYKVANTSYKHKTEHTKQECTGTHVFVINILQVYTYTMKKLIEVYHAQKFGLCSSNLCYKIQSEKSRIRIRCACILQYERTLVCDTELEE